MCSKSKKNPLAMTTFCKRCKCTSRNLVHPRSVGTTCDKTGFLGRSQKLTKDTNFIAWCFSLVYFFWEKNKVITTLRNLSTIKNPIEEVSFHPKDRSVVCVIGQGIFKMCRCVLTLQRQLYYSGKKLRFCLLLPCYVQKKNAIKYAATSQPSFTILHSTMRIR